VRLDHFRSTISPYWVRFIVGHAELETTADTLRFVADGGRAGELSDAQIDDYHHHARDHLPWRAPLTMEVRARASHPAGQLVGTAGFGFWNDPVGLEAGPAALPNAVWFFYASPHSDMAFVPGVPGHGWKAGLINGGYIPPLAVSMGAWLLSLPGLGRLACRAAQTQFKASEKLLEVSLTEWHTYRLEWRREAVTFFVDDQFVHRAPHPPTVPLGFVAWLDNQCAIVRPNGDLAFRQLDVPQRQWLELDFVRIEG